MGYEGSIGSVDAQGNGNIFLVLPEGSIGNAIVIDSNKYMYIADYTNHNILKANMTNKDIEIFCHDENMNQPNDICRSQKGIMYASDPNWKDETGQLWMISPEGVSQKVEGDMGTTNGICLSPDETKLYVNESIQRKVWAYDLDEKGMPTNKQLLHEFKDFGLDGMKCDIEGNIYVARYDQGAIDVLSPEGKLVKSIELTGKKPTNITFGGTDNKTCYVTMQTRGCIETFENGIPGK